jgi:hypothetical protein
MCEGVWGDGVESQAACWIFLDKMVHIVFNVVPLFSGACRIFRKDFQFVIFVLEVGALGVGTNLECKVMKTVE